MLLNDETLHGLTVAAFERLEGEIGESLPLEATSLLAWTRSLTPEKDPLRYFLRREAFPLLAFPLWLRQALLPDAESGFDGDLVYSSINGYYFIRMVDNVMDGEGAEELPLLPALGFFHLRFHGAYQRHFAADHPFWPQMDAIWSTSADRTIHDGRLAEIDRQEFERTCGAKFCASRIPVAAVCHRAGREELLEPWGRFLDTLGNWYQMRNDVYDWLKDPRLGLQTYFLSEWQRRRRGEESLQAWFAREGFDWSTAVLDGYMDQLRDQAPSLACPVIAGYLETRHSDATGTARAVRAGLGSLDLLARAFQP